jgi:hypothetical protein
MANAVTDAAGVATFDWIPRDATEEVGSTFQVRSPGFHWPDPPESIFRVADDVEVTARLLRSSVITGTVTMPDGRPAPPDMLVVAEGRGDTVHVGRAVARTELGGRYTMHVAPQQTYAVIVADDFWIARRDGVVVAEDTLVEGVDLTLDEGVQLQGRLTYQGDPVAGELVLLGLTRPARERADAGPDGYWQRFEDVVLQRTAFTGRDGRYSFRVSAGEYVLCAMDAEPGDIHEPQRITIRAGQDTDVRRDFVKSGTVGVLGTAGGPFRAMRDEVYEFAFQPAWKAGRRDGAKACMQCHRPHRPARAGAR